MLSNIYKKDGKPFWPMNFKSIKAVQEIRLKIHNNEWSTFKRICPSCDTNQKLELLSEKNKYGLEQKIVICKICGIVFYDNCIDYQATQDFYKNYYIDLCTGGADVNAIHTYQVKRGGQLLQFLLKNNIQHPKKILEIGCGTAGISKALKTHFTNCEFYGLDYRSDDIEIALKNGIHVFEYSEDIYKELEQMNFDLIIAYHVVEHFVDIKNELLKIKSIMNENTLLMIGVPGILSTYDFYNTFIESISMDHNYYFSSKTLKNALASVGIDCIYIDEEINSICKVNCNKYLNNIENDYTRIMNYLNINEPKNYIKYVLILKLKKIKQFISNLVKNEK